MHANIREIDTSGISAIRGMTPQHMERRRQYVTASNIPAIAGVDQYRNAADVYLWMVGAIDETESSEPAAIGTAAEPTLQALTEAAIGKKLTRRGAWNTKGCMGATLDALVADDRRLGAQFKTSGKAEDWEQGPPTRVVVQVHAEMVCAELDACYVAALLGGFGPLKFRLYLVERDAQLAADVERLANTFMDKYITPRVLPPRVVASGETLRRVLRVPNKTVVVDDALMENWLAKRNKRLSAQKLVEGLEAEEEEAFCALLSAMGDAEAAECGKGILTYLEQNRKGYAVAPSTYRVARFKAKEQPVVTPAAAPQEIAS